ncbi:hypothetical protein HYX13_03755 [Candidatus Woesearchaeota archaeon]|nr:hypothetical protein [Candidatus Woesearchaeota archaeon]
MKSLQKNSFLFLIRFLGELGVAKAGPMLLGERYKNNHFILKVNHTAVDEVKSALILIKSIKSMSVILRSRRISGTIKKLSEVHDEPTKTND